MLNSPCGRKIVLAFESQQAMRIPNLWSWIGAFAVLVCCCAPPLAAIPQFSLLSGNKCLNCHVNAQGAGLRNELGWYSRNDVSLLDLEALGLAEAFEDLSPESNQAFDGLLTYGLDFRFQTSRSHRDENASRRFFPMQGALYAAAHATDWLDLRGMFSGGPLRYPGQKRWSASLVVQPSFAYPSLQVGFIQPSIGMRYDDHTMLARSIANESFTPLIAPNYAEYGAEINYEGLKWLSVTGGVFHAGSLAEDSVTGAGGTFVSLIEDENTPSLLGRLVFWPRFEDGAVNTWLGASYLLNDDFNLLNVFAGVGLTDLVALMAEFARSDKEDLRTTENISAEVLYQVQDALMLYLRGETGTTQISFTDQEGAPVAIEDSRTQVVLGAQVFLLPYLEIRPEYRLVDVDKEPRTVAQFRSTRWHVQAHLFF